ncbi:TPA: recombinase family protein [Aeromonas dhakensis]|uniref:recombinase family protein n=1 Tax=Aeromonas dhakensis TaxID=196024 RepID=UPI00288D7B35|nr:recombinase family protein [Aeromonas dhakensis]
MSRLPKAYSYIRFSTPKQAQGDSYRRQIQQAIDYCAKHNLELDEKAIEDFGVSGFRGSNWTDGALGRFIEAVKSGAIAKGSYLLVESMDRLSRQTVLKAFSQFIEILNAGIAVVTLSDGEIFRATDDGNNFDFAKLIISIVYMARANDESEMKSRRSRAAWSNGRKEARESNKVMTNSRLPTWLTREGERIVPIPERAAIVNEMFEMAKSGCGYEQIAKAFLEKGYKTFGKEADWRPAGIQAVIKSQAVIGVFQPHVIENGERVPDGEPILGYYPTIVSPALFEEVQHLIGTRSKHSGSYRKGTYSNLFSGVLRCQCGELLRYHNKGKAGNPRNYLVCPKQNITGCNLPNMLYGKVEPQLLQAVSLLSAVMGQRGAASEKTLALKDELAILQRKLELEAKKRNKAAQSMLELDDDAVFRELFTQCKANCQALEVQIHQLEDDIMGRELSEKTLGKMIVPDDLKNTEQRQRFNSQLKAAVKEISIISNGDSVAAVFKDLDGQFMLEQAFKPKLAGSSIRDISGEELLRTTAEDPYIDADWVKAEINEFESIHHKSDSEFDDDFEDLSSGESK